jgi:hypothetical protein
MSAFTVRGESGQIQISTESIRSIAQQEQPAELATGTNQEFFQAPLESATDELHAWSAPGFREWCRVLSSCSSVERGAGLISSHLAEQASFYIRAP